MCMKVNIRQMNYKNRQEEKSLNKRRFFPKWLPLDDGPQERSRHTWVISFQLIPGITQIRKKNGEKSCSNRVILWLLEVEDCLLESCDCAYKSWLRTRSWEAALLTGKLFIASAISLNHYSNSKINSERKRVQPTTDILTLLGHYFFEGSSRMGRYCTKVRFDSSSSSRAGRHSWRLGLNNYWCDALARYQNDLTFR